MLSHTATSSGRTQKKDFELRHCGCREKSPYYGPPLAIPQCRVSPIFFVLLFLYPHWLRTYASCDRNVTTAMTASIWERGGGGGGIVREWSV